ncbi:MAG: hypothetical protein C0475_00995 [Planctomyces sp.]|nr:hypothetical protein [Planctomyces sp.]
MQQQREYSMSYSGDSIKVLAGTIKFVCGLAVCAAVVLPAGIAVLATVYTNNVANFQDFWAIVVAHKIEAGIVAGVAIMTGLITFVIVLIPTALAELLLCLVEIEKNTRKS